MSKRQIQTSRRTCAVLTTPASGTHAARNGHFVRCANSSGSASSVCPVERALSGLSFDRAGRWVTSPGVFLKRVILRLSPRPTSSHLPERSGAVILPDSAYRPLSTAADGRCFDVDRDDGIGGRSPDGPPDHTPQMCPRVTRALPPTRHLVPGRAAAKESHRRAHTHPCLYA
jgi:hypothetical protein